MLDIDTEKGSRPRFRADREKMIGRDKAWQRHAVLRITHAPRTSLSFFFFSFFSRTHGFRFCALQVQDQDHVAPCCCCCCFCCFSSLFVSSL
jgi:hypothetical protein